MVSPSKSIQHTIVHQELNQAERDRRKEKMLHRKQQMDKIRASRGNRVKEANKAAPPSLTPS